MRRHNLVRAKRACCVKGGGPSFSDPANGPPPNCASGFCAEIKTEYRYLCKLPRGRFEATAPNLLGEAYLYGSLQVYVLWAEQARCSVHCTVRLDGKHSVAQLLYRTPSERNPGARDAVGPLACKSSKRGPRRRTPTAEDSSTPQRIATEPVVVRPTRDGMPDAPAWTDTRFPQDLMNSES